ncbi:serine hydrolase domain-containing protein [Idiomarina aquatica]|uniref:Beta-lactamase n=1 Tax=Idiomarina aquatica TaxID=1327752 RepID=A0AA94EEE5_9GAMM|nr:serine hydrolase domain-containing protein [Idiomarina aquatica]RUO43406.1 hypothetical protein CWE23_08645 [Idiomarina aquatica]
MRKQHIAALLLMIPTALAAQDIAEPYRHQQYQGELVLNASASLPLQLNLGEDKATLDSPAQGAFGIPIDEVNINAEQLSFSSATIQASYNGKRDENACYAGEFTQGATYQLTLCPAQQQAVKTPQQALAELPVAVAIVSYTDGQWQVDKDAFNIEAGKQFEIGSVSKTLVAWLLADALSKGLITEDTRLKAYWPEANEQVADIRLVDLATHHSGLPRLPENLTLTNINDPYVDFGMADLKQAVADASVSLPANYQYSNFGYGLLAETLAKVYDTTFADLMQDKLFTELGLSQSYLALEPVDNPQLIAGTRIDGKPVPHWHFDAMAGAGAVVSTLDDMVRYVQAVMRPAEQHRELVQQLLKPRETLGENSQQALGWLIDQQDGQQLIWHNGQTAGFASFVGFNDKGTRAVVILNSRARSVTEMGKSLLTSDLSL